LGLARTSHVGDSAPATTSVTVAPSPVGPGVDRDADLEGDAGRKHAPVTSRRRTRSERPAPPPAGIRALGLEQALGHRLAIFAGGFTVEAAEQVCADRELPAAEVADLVERLVDRSFLVPEVGTEGQTATLGCIYA